MWPAEVLADYCVQDGAERGTNVSAPPDLIPLKNKRIWQEQGGKDKRELREKDSGSLKGWLFSCALSDYLL